MSILGRITAALVLAALLVPATAKAWPHDHLGVLVQNAGSSSRSASDGQGGVFIASSKYSFVSSSYDVYLQRFDANGTAYWPEPGMLVCGAPDAQYVEGIVPDRQGGCIVAWLDNRTPANGYDYYAQRVSAAGAMLWAADGVEIVAAAGNQFYLKLACDGTYAWFVWADPRNVATGSDIYSQTVPLWSGAPVAVNGTAVCALAGEQTLPDLAVDAYGYARVVWSDGRSATYDIYAQSLLWNGVPQWAVNGVLVCNAASQQSDPRVVMLGGRAFVAWSDFRGADFDVYAQLLNDYSGSAIWATNGVPVYTGSGHQSSPRVLADGEGDVFVAWLDQRRGSIVNDVYAQKIDGTGTMAWSSAGVPVRVATGGGSSMDMALDGAGGVYIAWNDSRVDISDLYLQRLTAMGGTMWSTNGVKVGVGTGSQAGATLVPVAGGGVKVTWDDYGSSPWGVKHQFVDEWGYTGANPTLASVKDVPNDQGGQVKLSWYASPLDTDPLYRNITDYIVFRSAPTALAAQLAARITLGEDGLASAAVNGKRYVRFPSAAQDYFWEELAHVTPRHLSQYSFLASTEGDSVAGSNPRTAFMIMAVANWGGGWWTSNADSGYSVDNLAPAAPAPLTGQYGAGTIALHWEPNAEPDLAGYRVYRGTSAAFVPSPANLVAALPDTGYAGAASAPYFYKVTALDTHGNESPVATLLPSGTLAVDGGAARAMFAAPAPNPLRGGGASTLRFALATGGRAKLALYDAQGRVARVLVDGALEAGEHTVTLRGDGLAPGLYLARLESPGFAGVRRVMVVE